MLKGYELNLGKLNKIGKMSVAGMLLIFCFLTYRKIAFRKYSDRVP